MVDVSNADRVVFPEIGKTKGDVVAYYDRVSERMLPHVIDRPISIIRYPKGLAGSGFFQKNMPKHYPSSFGKAAIPRSEAATKRHRDPEARERNETVYPVVREQEHLPYLANQGAIEMHVPTARAASLFTADRVVLDLDPPAGAIALVRKAAHIVRDVLGEHGLKTVPVATGSKGYHLVANVKPIALDRLGVALHQLTALLSVAHPDELTVVFRVAKRGGRVFLDWMRNHPLATVVAPYSLRAKPKATVATPLQWDEIDSIAPDGFTIDDVDRVIDRPDSLIDLAPSDAEKFASSVAKAFDKSGLDLEDFGQR